MISIRDERLIRRVKELRAQNLTQPKIASIMGVSQWIVSKILDEKKLIDVKLYNELMKIKEERDSGKSNKT